jgi:hypothetical protein
MSKLAGSRHSTEGDERRFLQVFADSLSGFHGVSFDVQQVVHNLKRQSEVSRERLESRDVRLRG